MAKLSGNMCIEVIGETANHYINYIHTICRMLAAVFIFTVAIYCCVLPIQAETVIEGQFNKCGAELVILVKKTLKEYLINKKIMDQYPNIKAPDGVKGVFVTLSLNGKTRGCSGTFSFSGNSLSREVAYHTIRAATADPRYSRILPNEISRIKVSVTFILSLPQNVPSLDYYHPAYQGVIFKNGERTLIFLPGERRYPRTLMEEARQTVGEGAISIFVFSARRVGEK